MNTPKTVKADTGNSPVTTETVESINSQNDMERPKVETRSYYAMPKQTNKMPN